MSNYNSLKATIDANIKQNGNQEITGQILNSVLNQMVTTLGAGYQFAGVATINTNPGTPDAKVFYIANGKGTYEKFGGINVTEDEVVVLCWDSLWNKVSTGIASDQKLSELEQQINGEQDQSIDLSTIEQSSYIVYSDHWSMKGNKHIVYPIEEGKHISIIGNATSSGAYCFLKSYEVPTDTATPFVYCDGFNNSVTIGKNQELELTAPTDCKYIYFNAMISGLECLPQLFVIHGQGGGLTEAISEIETKVDDLETKVTENIGDYKEVNLDTIVREKYIISNSTGNYSSPGYSHIVIPIFPETKVTIIGNENVLTSYTFLKSHNPTSGVKADFCDGLSLPTFIPLGETISMNAPADANFLYFSVSYNSNGECLPRSVVIGNNVIGGIKEEVNYLNQIAKPFKRVLCLGDSITDGVNAINGRGNGYPKYMQSILGCDVINCGIGGTRMTPRGGDSGWTWLDGLNLVKAICTGDFTKQIKSVYEDLTTSECPSGRRVIDTLSSMDFSTIDAVVILWGGNDYSSDIALGNVNSIDEITISGCLNNIIKLLTNHFPSLPIYIITSSVRYATNDMTDDVWSDTYVNGAGVTMKDITNRIVEICESSHIPCFNYYKECGFTKENFGYWFQDYSASEGFKPTINRVHPSRGYIMMAHRIGAWLKSRW